MNRVPINRDPQGSLCKLYKSTGIAMRCMLTAVDTTQSVVLHTDMWYNAGSISHLEVSGIIAKHDYGVMAWGWR